MVRGRNSQDIDNIISFSYGKPLRGSNKARHCAYFHFSLTEFSVVFQTSSMSYNEAEPKDCKNVDDHLSFVQFVSR